MIILENDDIIFMLEEILYLGEKLDIFVVFDLYYYMMNNE